MTHDRARPPRQDRVAWSGEEWERSTARNGELWTLAEEKHLERLYAKPRKVIWMGKPRSKAMYYAAKVLKRTPCACANRMQELIRSRRRQP